MRCLHIYHHNGICLDCGRNLRIKEVSCVNCKRMMTRRNQPYCALYDWTIPDPKISAELCDHYEQKQEIRFKVGKPEKQEFTL